MPQERPSEVGRSLMQQTLREQGDTALAPVYEKVVGHMGLPEAARAQNLKVGAMARTQRVLMEVCVDE